MSDHSQLEHDTLAAVEAASDETALEAVRVAALGKKGSISALLATLGKMSPEERKSRRREDQRVEGQGRGGVARAQRRAQGSGARCAARRAKRWT